MNLYFLEKPFKSSEQMNVCMHVCMCVFAEREQALLEYKWICLMFFQSEEIVFCLLLNFVSWFQYYKY